MSGAKSQGRLHRAATADSRMSSNWMATGCHRIRAVIGVVPVRAACCACLPESGAASVQLITKPAQSLPPSRATAA